MSYEPLRGVISDESPCGRSDEFPINGKREGIFLQGSPHTVGSDISPSHGVVGDVILFAVIYPPSVDVICFLRKREGIFLQGKNGLIASPINEVYRGE